MKELKKEALKIFSKNNAKNLATILLIKLVTNTLLIFVTFATIYVSFPLELPAILGVLTFAKTNLPRIFSSLLFCVLIFTFLTLIPLKIGFYLWLSEIKKDSQASLLTVFRYYKSFHFIARAIAFEVLLLIRTIIIFFLYFAPTIGTFLLACINTHSTPETNQLFLRLLILASAATILSATVLFLKSLLMQISAKFLFVMSPQKSLFSIIRSSSFLLRTNSKDFTRLTLSLWSCFFASFFILPIPLTFAYMQACLGEFTKKIVYKQNQGIVAIPLSQMVIDINSRPL